MDSSSWPSIARCNVSWSTRSMFKTPEGHMYGAPFCARTRGSRLLPALGVFASVLSWAFSGPASAADPTVRIFSGTDEHWVQFQVAKAKGFFKDEGLDAEVTVFTTGATATEAFRAGRGDFISAGDLLSAAMWKTGKVIGLAPLSSDTEIFGIVGKKEINAQGYLRGRKVATRIGSTGEFLLYRYLASGVLDRKSVG